MGLLTEYEDVQVMAIREWKQKEPGIIKERMASMTTSLSRQITRFIPKGAIRKVINVSDFTARWFTDKGDIIRDAGVSVISDLRTKDLELSDKIANEVHNWAVGIAVAEGAATGVGGIFTLTVDIPTIITLALRTIHKIGLCYGYELADRENDKQFILCILAISGANSMDEKISVLDILRSFNVDDGKKISKVIAQSVADYQMSKKAAVIGIQKLATQLGINITKRKVFQIIPVLGVLVGGSVNGWYLRDVGWAARYLFQERWMIDNQKIVEI